MQSQTPFTPPLLGEVAVLSEYGRQCLPPAQLQDYAQQLQQADADAYVLAPGESKPVLAYPTTTVLVRRQHLRLLPSWLLQDVAGAARRSDPFTALLDVQWRLNLSAHTVQTCPAPVQPSPPISLAARAWRTRSLLSLLETNLSRRARGVLLPLAQILAVTQPLAAGGVDTAALDLQRRPGDEQIGTLALPASALSGAWGIDGALENTEKNPSLPQELQSARRVPEVFLLPLLKPALPTLLQVETLASPPVARLLDLLDVSRLLAQKPVLSVLGASAEAIKTELGLPGLLAAWPQTGSPDAVVFSGYVPDRSELARAKNAPICMDWRALNLPAWLQQNQGYEDRAQYLAACVRRADRFLVADESQRDFLLGALAGQGRVNDLVYDEDSSLTDLVSADGNALAAFCTRPARAADVNAKPPAPPSAPRTGDLALALKYLREGGVRQVAVKASGRLKRVAGRKEGK